MDGVGENLFYNGNTKEVTPLIPGGGGSTTEKKQTENSRRLKQGSIIRFSKTTPKRAFH